MTTLWSWGKKVGIAAAALALVLTDAGPARAQFGRMFGGGGGGGGGGFGGGGGRSLLDPLGVNPFLSGGFGNRGGMREQSPGQSNYPNQYYQQQNQQQYQGEMGAYRGQPQYPTQPQYATQPPAYTPPPTYAAPRVAAPAPAAPARAAAPRATARVAAPAPAPVAPPSNVVAEARPASMSTGPEPNMVVANLNPASEADRKGVLKLIDRRIEELRDEVEKALEPALFQDRDLRDCLALAEGKEATGDQLDLLSRDLKALKTNEVRDRLRNLRVGEAEYEPLIYKLDVSRTYEELKGELDNGAIPRVVKAKCKLLMKVYHRVGLPESSLRLLTDEVWLLGSLRSELEDRGAGAGTVNVGVIMTSPEITIVESPSVAPGSLLVLTPEVVLTGRPAGSPRRLTARLGSPTELGLPTVETSLPPASPAVPGASYSGLVLRNPKSNGRTVNYLLDNNPYSMGAGFDQKIGDKPSSLLVFDTGGKAGQVRFTLGAGTYEFLLEKTGWRIFRRDYAITLDNASNNNDFHYVLQDGTKGTVPAGQTRRITSAYPLTDIAFDMGNGQTTARKAIGEGTFTVALNAQSRLDLFKGRRVVIPAIATRPGAEQSVARSSTGEAVLRFPLGDVR